MGKGGKERKKEKKKKAREEKTPKRSGNKRRGHVGENGGRVRKGNGKQY